MAEKMIIAAFLIEVGTQKKDDFIGCELLSGAFGSW